MPLQARARPEADPNGRADRVTAAVLIIGDEILSGRTQDTNLNFIASYLGTYGVDLAEARVVPDIEAEIIDRAERAARPATTT